MFVFIGLFFMKLLCCRTDFSITKAIMAISIVLIAKGGDSYFDEDKNNDISDWIFQIPIGAFLIC